MSDENLLTRREFTVESIFAILAAATITISCGGDDNDVGPSPQPGDREGTVSQNHGHRAIVSSVQLNSSQTVTVDIRGNATHNHTLALTVAQLASIAANSRVVVTSSSDDGHTHTVTFN